MTARPDTDGAASPTLAAPSVSSAGGAWTVPPSAARWVVLTDSARPSTREAAPLRMRRIVAPIAVAALLVTAIVAGAGWLVGRRIAEQQAVHDVAELTDILAVSAVQPALTDAMLTDPATTRQVLDPLVRERVLTGELSRVKVWRADGTILYSDVPQLIGQRFALEDEALAALRTPRTEADISDLSRPENRLERPQGKLLEVYRPVWTPNGTPLLFETYFRYDAVTSRSHQLWRGFGGVMLSSIAALLVLLLPLAWALVLRSRRARVQREVLMRRALDASDESRRRIAATLHDGVVQQLAAASFLAAGAAGRAAKAGQRQWADEAEVIASAVRDGVAGLRSLLVDIYPPTLRSSGLAAALRDLARSTTADDSRVTTDVDDAAADSLPAEAQEVAFRVAQESLRNVVKHAQARDVRLVVRREADRCVLEVSDDGRGLDPDDLDRLAAEGHFGMQLMTDAAQQIGARLAVSSTAERGTTVRLEIV